MSLPDYKNAFHKYKKPSKQPEKKREREREIYS